MSEDLGFHTDHGYGLLLYFIERVGLVLDLPEVDVHEVDTADVAVPCSAVVQFQGFQIGG